MDKGRQLLAAGFIIAFVLLLTYSFWIDNIVLLTVQEASQEAERVHKIPNPLDGCLHIYLDVGTNRGIQIRKLYEPKLFPEAGVLPVFDKYFGNFSQRNLTEICAVGFEPNPAHTQLLKSTELAFRACNYTVIIHTQTGISNREGGGILTRNTLTDNDIGAKIIKEDGKAIVMTNIEAVTNITLIKLARYINEVVATRKLPASAQFITPRVLLKMDAEEAELEILPDLIMEGSLRFIDSIMIEWHDSSSAIKELRLAWEYIYTLVSNQHSQHFCEVVRMDDEAYGEYNDTAPACHSTPL